MNNKTDLKRIPLFDYCTNAMRYFQLTFDKRLIMETFISKCSYILKKKETCIEKAMTIHLLLMYITLFFFRYEISGLIVCFYINK